MKCKEVRKRLCAFFDHELPEEERRAFDDHIKGCADCREALKGLQCLSGALSQMPVIPAPVGFAGRVRQAWRALSSPPDFWQWWGHLSVAFRGAVCAVTLAGLVFGAVLGSSMTNPPDRYFEAPVYLTMYESRGVYP